MTGRVLGALEVGRSQEGEGGSVIPRSNSKVKQKKNDITRTSVRFAGKSSSEDSELNRLTCEHQNRVTEFVFVFVFVFEQHLN